MDLQQVRDLLRTEQIELELSLPHAVTEARKDGLTTEDLSAAVMSGEIVEDYGERILLLSFAPDYSIPFHVVLNQTTQHWNSTGSGSDLVLARATLSADSAVFQCCRFRFRIFSWRYGSDSGDRLYPQPRPLGSQLENPQTNQKEKMMRIRCTNKCPGKPESGETTQTFERRGSPVKVMIRMIPSAVCPLCHESYLSRETARQLDRLLEPFHGKHGFIPALPPAEVTIDFALAAMTLQAA